ncbi:hypothetical protein EYC80_004781 [Monilinia laxa]|uniref:Alcohol dehydrogenase-like N-terminal domain-containing protein n=1 Tax=Monilinia laxa TaxID=61186 RepID=A0A5N6KJG6_MONLA|nr:hypothetical protein EYC80_004781 [Monilinia laxa]
MVIPNFYLEYPREVIARPSPEIWTEITEFAIPEPRSDEVVIKVIVAGSNVKDWLHLEVLKKPLNSGDDIADIIYSLGENGRAKNEFHLGDRVAAFHLMLEPYGAYAEYAVAPMYTLMKLSDSTTFEGCIYTVSCHDLSTFSVSSPAFAASKVARF